MKKIIVISFLILSFLPSALPAKAFEQINKFGIHILSESDLSKAAELVNSQGGDWGFITIVIRIDELDLSRWQKFFDDCRRLHLVPQVRIATQIDGQNWTKPSLADAQTWATFLDSLNWPVKNQYVIIFNEPNQAKEWGGEINPEEYAQILSEYYSKFKAQNPNFKILNAGFDLAAPNSKTTMEVSGFWKAMEKAVPGIFNTLDGWASHFYSLNRDYRWERNLLQTRFSVRKDLPIFITEAGWPLFENIWLKDDQVVSVTPFVLNYPQPPFANFSWLDKEGNPKLQYLTVKNMPKLSWWPEQEFGFKLEKIYLPPFMPTNTQFQGSLVILNTGQSIWGERERSSFPIQKLSQELSVTSLEIPHRKNINPGKSLELSFLIKSSPASGEFSFSWEQFPEYKVRVLPSSIITQAPYTFWQKVLLWLEKRLGF